MTKEQYNSYPHTLEKKSDIRHDYSRVLLWENTHMHAKGCTNLKSSEWWIFWQSSPRMQLIRHSKVGSLHGSNPSPITQTLSLCCRLVSITASFPIETPQQCIARRVETSLEDSWSLGSC